MSLPVHYQKLYAGFIRLACWMSLFALLAGILFQESGRKVPYAKFPAGIHWESVQHLAVSHGHIFLIGVVIPIAVLAMLYFCLVLNAEPLSEKSVRWGSRLYTFGAVVAVLLMLYKGYHFLLAVRGGELDFAVIERSYFAGQHILRAVVYALSHISLAVGLGYFVVGILRSLPKMQAPEG